MLNFNQPLSPIGTSDLRTPKFDQAKITWKETKEKFSAHPYMEYQKVLGFGGFGIVQQWSTYNPDGSMGEDIAIKATVASGREMHAIALQNEIRWCKEFKGREHLMQLRDVRDDPTTEGAYNDETDPAPCMIMEVLPHGNLSDTMDRVRLAKATLNPMVVDENEKLVEYFPCRILWRVLLCMTRACLEIAFPPPDTPQDPPQDPPPDPEQPPQLYRGQDIPGQNPRPIVHFDIDLTNVFVGPFAEPTDTEHEKFPICKLADYGIMCEWDDDWELSEKRQRSAFGKPSYKAPEHVDRRRVGIPGVYGAHTNIWGIGITLFLLICTTYRFDNRPGRSYQRRLGNGISIDTYGYTLLDDEYGPVNPFYEDIDLQLRETIARCLAVNGAQRPTLRQLLALAVQNIGEGDRKAQEAGASQMPNDIYATRPKLDEPEPDALLDRFMRNYFYDAAPVQDPYGPYWDRLTTPEPSN
ncbi:kinase-like domain-containing protein [Xylaria telfairii]|nr:kinase-like domain-containing protein [Xylaria telfairii]